MTLQRYRLTLILGYAISRTLSILFIAWVLVLSLPVLAFWQWMAIVTVVALIRDGSIVTRRMTP